MEILKTSEIMEKQIIDEARKKANKILQNADKECQKAEQDVKNQFEDNIKHLEEKYSLSYEKMVKDLAAILPLDLKRRKLAFIEKIIQENLNDFFKNLTPSELKSILETWLGKVKEIFANSRVHVRYNGLKAEEVNSLVASRIPGAQIVQLVQADKADAFTGLLLSSEDEKQKYRCTLTEVKQMLLDKFREEMYKVLFKEQI